MNDSVAATLPLMVCPQAVLSGPTASGLEGYWQQLQRQRMQENSRGGDPAQETLVSAVWSDSGLRVLFEVFDNDVWATLTDRDAPLYTEEVVEVFIDPVGDLESYFEIEVNPLNAVLDVVCRRNRGGFVKDFSWRCEALETAVSTTPTGWNCEMHIPFASLTSLLPQVGSEWRINFLRIDRPKNRERELSAWSPTMIGTFHVPAKFGRLQFGK